MDFRSDNVASAAPEIVDAVAQAARGSATPYGGDPWTEGWSLRSPSYSRPRSGSSRW